MNGRPASVVLLWGAEAAIGATLIPVALYVAIGNRTGFSSWGDVAVKSLSLSALIVATSLIVWGWLRLRVRLERATATARAHQARDELRTGPTGRVHHATPRPEERAQLIADLEAGALGTEHPSAIARWWFALEGWQQVAMVAGIAGAIVAVALRAALDQDGFQRADLFGLAFVWSVVLWFGLAIWATRYALRAHPSLGRFTARDGRNYPAGVVGSLFALEVFPRAVWFLVKLMLSAAIAPATRGASPSALTSERSAAIRRRRRTCGWL